MYNIQLKIHNDNNQMTTLFQQTCMDTYDQNRMRFKFRKIHTFVLYGILSYLRIVFPT